MKQLRLGLALLALAGSGYAHLKAHALIVESEAFINRSEHVKPEQFRGLYPNVVHFLELQGLYPDWPKDLSPVEGKNRMTRAHRDLLLCHRQLTTTGWGLLAASILAFWLHFKCPTHDPAPNGEQPSC